MARLNDLGPAVEEPVAVKPAAWSWVNGGLVLLGVVGIIVAVITVAMQASAAVIAVVAITSLVSLLSGIVDVVRRARRAILVTEHEQGIAIQDGRRRLAVAFDEMAGLATAAKDMLSNGQHVGMIYTFSIWRDTDFKRKPLIKVEGKYKAGQQGSAAFAKLLERLVERRTDRMQTALDREEKVEGDGFLVDAGSLRAGTTQVALDDIVANGVWDQRACFWKRGESMPIIGLPREGANVTALLALVTRRIEARGDEADGDVEGLGRVLFERRAKPSTIRITVGVAVLALASAGGALVAMFVGRDMAAAVIWFAISAGVAALLAWGAFALWRGTFRCHERGVYQKGAFSETSMTYEDVDTFTYGATRMYYNGAYTGTSLVLKFMPLAGPPTKPINYTTTVQGRDEDLDALRDHIAGVIAGRMLRQIAAGANVPWLPDASLDPDGVHFRRRKLIGKGQADFVPYTGISGFDINDGQFVLFADGEEKAIIQVPVSTVNFFPGFFALAHIMGDDEEAHDEASTAPDQEPTDVG